MITESHIRKVLHRCKEFLVNCALCAQRNRFFCCKLQYSEPDQNAFPLIITLLVRTPLFSVNRIVTYTGICLSFGNKNISMI